MNQQEKRLWLIRQLLAENSRYRDIRIPSGESDQKDLLRALMNEAADAIEELTAAVPVLRCAECKHYNDTDEGKACTISADLENEYFFGFVNYTGPDDFCSSAELRQEATE